LVKLGERVQVDRQPLTEAEITAYTRELRPIAARIGTGSDDDHPSFFEFMTAMAFLQFQRRGANIGIVEVGLGGRLDATNIVQPEVVAITSIGLDHTEQLGDRIELIAAEKAGIIKSGCPAVMGRVPPEAEAVIRARAQAMQAPLVSVAEQYGPDVEKYPHTNLEGDYQRWNAATATLVARALPARWRVTEAAITAGLERVDWPGRWQRVRLGERLLVLDASHNPEGAAVLASNLENLVRETGRKPVIITGVLGMARAGPLLEIVARHAVEIHLVVPQQARACTHADLETIVPRDFTGPVVQATVAGLFPTPETCTAGGPDDVLVVTGSIYLLGEIMARLTPAKGPGEGRLQDF
jgi:dihydrofolate synthase/folylpolyglutamate synthase